MACQVSMMPFCKEIEREREGERERERERERAEGRENYGQWDRIGKASFDVPVCRRYRKPPAH